MDEVTIFTEGLVQGNVAVVGDTQSMSFLTMVRAKAWEAALNGGVISIQSGGIKKQIM